MVRLFRKGEDEVRKGEDEVEVMVEKLLNGIENGDDSLRFSIIKQILELDMESQISLLFSAILRLSRLPDSSIIDKHPASPFGIKNSTVKI